jgi:hypothetical protein
METSYNIPRIIEVDLTANLAVLAVCSGQSSASESGCNCGNSGCHLQQR